MEGSFTSVERKSPIGRCNIVCASTALYPPHLGSRRQNYTSEDAIKCNLFPEKEKKKKKVVNFKFKSQRDDVNLG